MVTMSSINKLRRLSTSIWCRIKEVIRLNPLTKALSPTENTKKQSVDTKRHQNPRLYNDYNKRKYRVLCVLILQLKVIPGEAGFRTDFFQIWNNN